MDPRTDETIWGTAALKHATSWSHIDDEGFGTVVTNMVGAKYWVLARHKQDAPSTSHDGDMGSVHAFGSTIDPTSVGSERYEHEALLLTPGTVL
jgi:hypothetical protein